MLPARLARLLGAETLMMTNATGGLRPELGAGSLALITDQINFTGLNPLKGEIVLTPNGRGTVLECQ